MKTVLWISRHQMTPKQYHDLERIMKDEVRLIQWSETIPDAASLGKSESSMTQVDAVAAVLPPDLLGELLKIAGEKPVLRAVSSRLPTGRIVTLSDGRQEQEFQFVHVCWEQVLKVEIQTRRL